MAQRVNELRLQSRTRLRASLDVRSFRPLHARSSDGARGVRPPAEILQHHLTLNVTLEDYVGERRLEHLGKGKWRKSVFDVIERLDTALLLDDIVIGGGSVDRLKELPQKCR